MLHMLPLWTPSTAQSQPRQSSPRATSSQTQSRPQLALASSHVCIVPSMSTTMGHSACRVLSGPGAAGRSCPGAASGARWTTVAAGAASATRQPRRAARSMAACIYAFAARSMAAAYGYACALLQHIRSSTYSGRAGTTPALPLALWRRMLVCRHTSRTRLQDHLTLS